MYLIEKDRPVMPSLSRDIGNKREKGQSFVELSLIVIFLMIFVAGIVEFGFMLNNYLNLVDASREAVRYSSNFDPFLPGCTDHTSASCLDTQFFEDTVTLTRDVLRPLELDASAGDDIVVTFFSVGDGVFLRFPNAQGWAANSNQVSKLSNAVIQSRLDSGAPPTGVLLVEIFYNYHQVLKLPIFTAFVRDPMPVYAYAIMPLSAAEPIPTP
jgi:TadE-like protein